MCGHLKAAVETRAVLNDRLRVDGEAEMGVEDLGIRGKGREVDEECP